MDEVLGTGVVEIVPEVDKSFKARAEAAVRRALSGVDRAVDQSLARVPTTIRNRITRPFDRAATQVTAAANAAGEGIEEGISSGLNAAGRDISKFSAEARARLARIDNGNINLDIVADTDEARLSLEAFIQSEDGRHIGLDVTIDRNGRLHDALTGQLTRTSDAFKQIRRELQGVTDESDHVVQEVTRATHATDDLGRSLGKLNPLKGQNSFGQLQFTFAKMAVSAGLLLNAITPVGPALVGVAAGATAVAGAVGLAAGSLVSLGGVFASLGLAFAAVKVGSKGVGDALKAQSEAQKELSETGEISAETQKKLDAALKGLAPSAQNTVKAIAKIGPAWSKVQKATQQELFRGQAKNISALDKAFRPLIGGTLKRVGAAMSQASTRAREFLTSAEGRGNLTEVFNGLEKTFKAILPAIGQVGRALLGIFAGASGPATSMAESFANAAERFADFIDGANRSGRLTKFFHDANNAASVLVGVIGKLAGVIGGVLGAGAGHGVELLESFSHSLGQLKEAIGSVEGEEALSEFFKTTSTVARVFGDTVDVLGPILAGAGSALKDFNTALDDLRVVLKPIAARISQGLGKVLKDFGKILGDTIKNFAALLDTIGPIVPLLVPLAAGFVALNAALNVSILGRIVLAFVALDSILGFLPDKVKSLAVQVIALTFAFKALAGLKFASIFAGAGAAAAGAGTAAAGAATGVAAAGTAAAGAGTAAAVATGRLARLKGAFAGLKGAGGMAGVAAGFVAVSEGLKRIDADATTADVKLGLLATTLGGVAAGAALGGVPGAALGGAGGFLLGLNDVLKAAGPKDFPELPKIDLSKVFVGLDDAGQATETTKRSLQEFLRLLDDPLIRAPKGVNKNFQMSAESFGIPDKKLIDAMSGDAKQLASIKKQINKTVLFDPRLKGAGDTVLNSLAAVTAEYTKQADAAAEATGATRDYGDALKSLKPQQQRILNDNGLKPDLEGIVKASKEIKASKEDIQVLIDATGRKDITPAMVLAELRKNATTTAGLTKKMIEERKKFQRELLLANGLAVPADLQPKGPVKRPKAPKLPKPDVQERLGRGPKVDLGKEQREEQAAAIAANKKAAASAAAAQKKAAAAQKKADAAAAAAAKRAKAPGSVLGFLTKGGKSTVTTNFKTVGAEKAAKESKNAAEAAKGVPTKVDTMLKTLGAPAAAAASKSVADAANSIPPKKETTVNVKTGSSETRAKNVRDALNDIRGKNVSVGVNTGNSISKLDALLKKLRQVAPLLGSVAAGGPFAEPRANGTITNGPEVALIGEAGREAVIPLTKPGRALELADQSGLTAMIQRRAMLGMRRAASGLIVGGAERGSTGTVTEDGRIIATSVKVSVIGPSSQTIAKAGAATAKAFSKGFLKGLGGSAEQIKKRFASITKQVNKAAAGMSASVKKSLKGALSASKSQLLALAAQRDGLKKTMEDAKSNAESAGSSVTESINALGNISGKSNPVKTLQKAIKVAKEYTAAIASLKAAGLNSTSLQQIAEDDPAKAARTAKRILSGGVGGTSQVAAINALQKTLTASAKSAGAVTRDAVYQSGVAGAAGFAAGIKARRNEIEKQMASIARKLGITLNVLLAGKGKQIKLAGGGIFNRATQAIIGEAGKEVAIPLQQGSATIRDLIEKSNLVSYLSPGDFNALVAPRILATQKASQRVSTPAPARISVGASVQSTGRVSATTTSSATVDRSRTIDQKNYFTLLATTDPSQQSEQIARRLAAMMER